MTSEELIHLISEIKELEDYQYFPGGLVKAKRRKGIIAMRNKILFFMLNKELQDYSVGDWVIRHHPRQVTKSYPAGQIQILTKKGFEKLKKL